MLTVKPATTDKFRQKMSRESAMRLIKTLVPYFHTTDVHINHIGEFDSIDKRPVGSMGVIQWNGEHRIIVFPDDIAYFKKDKRDVIRNVFSAYYQLRDLNLIG